MRYAICPWSQTWQLSGFKHQQKQEISSATEGVGKSFKAITSFQLGGAVADEWKWPLRSTYLQYDTGNSLNDTNKLGAVSKVTLHIWKAEFTNESVRSINDLLASTDFFVTLQQQCPEPEERLPAWRSVMKLEICQECGPTIKPPLTQEAFKYDGPRLPESDLKSYTESVTEGAWREQILWPGSRRNKWHAPVCVVFRASDSGLTGVRRQSETHSHWPTPAGNSACWEMSSGAGRKILRMQE